MFGNESETRFAALAESMERGEYEVVPGSFQCLPNGTDPDNDDAPRTANQVRVRLAAIAEGVSESEITERALTEYFNRRDHAS